MATLKKGSLQEKQYCLPYHYSDVFSEEQKLLWKIERRALLGLVIKHLGKVDGIAVLDAGCGDGRLIYEMQSRRVKMTGADSSASALSFARAFNPKALFVAGNLKNLKFKKNFDRIILMEVLEHLPNREIAKVLINLKSHLKPGGKLLVTTPSTNLPLQEKHEQHFTREKLARLLTPVFSKVAISGYQKNNWQRKLFILLRDTAFIGYPLRVKFPIIGRYYKFIGNYYEKYVLSGSPGQCEGLLAICIN